jgi:hypothetical protein
MLQRTTRATAEQYSSKPKILKIVCRRKERIELREKLEMLKADFET